MTHGQHIDTRFRPGLEWIHLMIHDPAFLMRIPTYYKIVCVLIHTTYVD